MLRPRAGAKNLVVTWKRLALGSWTYTLQVWNRIFHTVELKFARRNGLQEEMQTKCLLVLPDTGAVGMPPFFPRRQHGDPARAVKWIFRVFNLWAHAGKSVCMNHCDMTQWHL
jgi:hypothetical protein